MLNNKYIWTLLIWYKSMHKTLTNNPLLIFFYIYIIIHYHLFNASYVCVIICFYTSYINIFIKVVIQLIAMCYLSSVNIYYAYFHKRSLQTLILRKYLTNAFHQKLSICGFTLGNNLDKVLN